MSQLWNPAQLHHEGESCRVLHRQRKCVGIDVASAVPDRAFDSQMGVVRGERTQRSTGTSLEERHARIGEQRVLHLRKRGADEGERPQLPACYVLEGRGELSHLCRIPGLELIDSHQQPGALRGHMIGAGGKSGTYEGRYGDRRRNIALHRPTHTEDLYGGQAKPRPVIRKAVADDTE